MNSGLISYFNNIVSQKIKYLLIVFCYFLLFNEPVFATHIVGGQLTYRALGKGYVEITLIVRRDCADGTEPLDNPALIGVFYNSQAPNYPKAFRVPTDGVLRLVLKKEIILQPTIDSVCPSILKRVCVQQGIYIDTIFLPPDDRGYLLAYQRCCRNESLTNILDPLNTGLTFIVQISEENRLKNNSSPFFQDSFQFPPIYICKNKPFIYNHISLDDPTDSLVYKFCTPYKGKTMAFPGGRPETPFEPIEWKAPYGLNNLLIGNLSINANNGLITGMPTDTGQFLVAVCVDEFDRASGSLKGQIRRDFELNVVPCGVKPIANFERLTSNCDGLTVQFKSLSIDAQEYAWYFDWINDKGQFSTIKDPGHTYTHPGQYQVLLVVKNGECRDSIRKLFTVLDPQLKPDFDYTLDCKGSLNIQLKDNSTASDSIVKREWKLISPRDSLTSMERDPLFKLTGDGKIIITLVITDKNQCTATISKTIEANIIDVELKADSLTICRGDSTHLVRNPDPKLSYNWEPKASLDLTNPSDPIAYPSLTTTYTVTISDGPCIAIKKILVSVRDKIKVSITGDTSVCNGMVDLLAKSDSSTMFIWSLKPEFNPIIFMGERLKTAHSGTQTYYVKGGKEDQCPDSASITVHDRSIKLKYNKEETICADDTIVLNLVNLNSGDQLEILWEENPIIIGPRDVLNPTIYCPSPGKYVLYFKVKNQFLCELLDSIIIIAVPPPNPEFVIDYECGSLTIKVKTNSHSKVKWTFGDGVGTSQERSTSYTYKKSGKYIVCLEVDSVCSRNLCKEITIVELKSNLRDTVLSCFGSPVHLNPNGNPAYTYEWTPETGLDDPKSHNPLATVSKTTTYRVKIKDPNFPDDCFLEDSITVFVPPTLTLSAGPDTVLCEKTKINLCAIANLPGTKFEWCDKNNRPIGKADKIEVHPDSSTYYIVKAIDTYGCSLNDTVFVDLYELMAKIEGDDIICLGDTTFLKVLNLSGQSYTYDWNPKEPIIGSSTDSIIKVYIDKTTTFTVTIRNAYGCIWELSKTIQVNNPQVTLSVKAEPGTVVPGEKTQLTATFNPNWKYLWSPQNGTLSDSSIYNPIAFPLVTTSYTVTVTDENGCTASASVTVTVQSCLESVFIPNAFSPNDDRSNDVLYVRSRPNTITTMELVIYSRWGQKVFTSTNINVGWDGRFNGEALPPDVYGYGLLFSCHENREFVKKGNISIIK